MSESPPQSPQNPMLGRVILDRYEIVAQLGAGGMGAVYKAKQISMDRMVALKLIHPAIAGNEQVAARFHREMQAMTRIAHPNTVQVYDYGRTEDGQLFLAMELLAGRTLSATLLQEGAMPLPRLCHVTTQVLRALGAAHEEGIVHRDLKPDNVMLLDLYGEPDFVKVLDFGIARFVGAPGEDGSPTQMTAAGALLGTPAYMSPEQALGQAVGPATDLYALGIMLYQMATGVLPFSGNTLPQLILMHAREAPRPPSQIANVDPRLEALILELLQKDPAARPQPAGAVLARIEALGGEAGPEARPAADKALAKPAEQGKPGGPLLWTTEKPPPRRFPALAGVAVGAVLVAAGGFLALRPTKDPAARAKLSALIGAMGDPTPPASCQVTERAALRALVPAADLLAGGDEARARQALAALGSQLPAAARDSAEALYLTGRAHVALREAAPAADAASKAVLRCPPWAAAHNLLGNAHQLARKTEDAQRSYENAMAAAPDYTAPRYNLGILALRERSTTLAVRYFSQVLQRNPEDRLAHLARGQAFLLLDDTKNALLDLEEATKRQPDRAEAWMLLGQAQAKAGKAAAAKQSYCRAKALGSKDAAQLCP